VEACLTTLSETLLPYSIEEFVTDAEIARILAAVERYKAEHPARLAAGAKGITVHSSSVMNVDELVAMYQPQGRLDINTADLPFEVIDVIEQAFFRHIEDIRRAYPSATWPYAVTYVEYGPAQFFTPHADGFSAHQCAGFGVTLTNDFTGGEFCVETCGSNRTWVAGSDGTPNLAIGTNNGSEWFRKLPRTRWSMTPKKGTAAFYGSALVHSSRPVTSGTVKRLLAFISNG
jgi:hypothetical protein